MVDILVIGGGPAGVTAALRSRELGADVTLVERGRLGGTCTNDGCAPTRVLAKAARLIRDSEQFKDYGLYGDPPQLDLAQLMRRTQGVIYSLHEKKQLINHLLESGVKLHIEQGEARFLDPHTLSVGKDLWLHADRIILSVGGHARRLNFPGSEYTLTHSDVWSLKTLPRSLAIIGGAATGCQLASIFAAFGTKVTLLEIAPRLLPGEDEDVSKTMLSAFLERDIQVVTGIEGVDRIEKKGRILTLHIKQSGEIHAFETEAVVVSVGWPGNVDALNLAAAGVEVERGYIRVNDYLQTSADHIFAAGDITGRMMLVQSATYEAQAAAENAVLGIGQIQKHHIVPHGGFTDPEYGSVGLTQAKAQAEADVAVAMVHYSEMDRAVIDDHTVGFCKLIVSRETHRILGAHVVGEQALEIVQLVAAGMSADMWVEQLAELEIAYPTYTAIVGLAARRLVNELGVRPLAAQWRVLGKPLAEWERREQ